MVSPLLASLFDDPPTVHPTSPTGVWRTDNSCYSLIEEVVPRGAATLEMGLGLSTALFCLLGCTHTTRFVDPDEEQLFRKWAQRREISVDKLRFIVGKSEEILPDLELPALDAVFIDGGHGFPAPIIDWFYGASPARWRSATGFAMDVTEKNTEMERLPPRLVRPARRT